MNVSVIIPVYDDSARLKLCLECLAQQTLPHDQFEVIVVDNGSQDSPQAMVESFPFCRFAVEKTPGSYAARNHALRLARGEIIAFTDADCQPEPQWLAEAVAVLDSDPDCAIVGGDIQIFPKDAKRPTAVELYDVAFGLPQERQVTTTGKCMTANLITRRSVFDAVGGFNQDIYSGADHLWSASVVESGRKVVFCPTAIVRHPARDTMKGILTQARRDIGGRADRRKTVPYQGSLGHTLGILANLTVPDFRKIARGRRLLRSKGYGGLAWCRIVPIVLLIQYTRLWELVRIRLLGGRGERR